MLKNRIFKWNFDPECDLVFSVCGILHFVKYKEHTLIKWGKQSDHCPAPKYLREE